MNFNVDKRGWKVLVHASTWFAPILVPILVYIFIHDREVRSLSIQAVLFHVIMALLIGVSFTFSFLLIGIPFLLLFGAISIIVSVIGIIYTIRNRPYHYPFLGSIVEK